MAIIFEKDDLATIHYVDLPAKAVVEGRLYDVLKWSLHGFCLKGGAFDLDSEVTLAFILPFPTHDCRLTILARITKVERENLHHFRFLDLTSYQRKLMRDYFECRIQGNGFAKEPLAAYELVPPLPEKQKKKADRKLMRRAVFYGFVALALGLVACFVAREFQHVYSMHGTVMGSLVQYKSPDQGFIKSVKVKEGEEVQPGQVLYELNDHYYANKLAQLRQLKDKTTQEWKQALESIREEESRIKLFAEASRHRESVLKQEIAITENQLALSRLELERAQVLARTNASSVQDLQIRTKEMRQIELLLEKNKLDYAFQQLVTKEAEKGRYYSGIDIRGNLPALRENAAKKETEIEQIKVQIVDLENSIAKTRVVSNATGKVHTLNRMGGDYVSTGDFVVAVQSGTPTTIGARFTADDAKYLLSGTEVTIMIPAHNEVVRGKIVAIGHTGLTAVGVASPDQETALLDVPVKIELERPLTNVRVGEGVDIKVKRHWSMAAFLQKLF